MASDSLQILHSFDLYSAELTTDLQLVSCSEKFAELIPSLNTSRDLHRAAQLDQRLLTLLQAITDGDKECTCTHQLAPSQMLRISWHISHYKKKYYLLGHDVIDITGPSLSEKNLQTNLDNILQHLPGFVYWKDKNSVYLGCNENFAHAAGLNSFREIVGKTDFDLAWKETEAEEFRRGDREVLAGHAKYDFEETQLMASGKFATVLATKVPLFDEHKNAIGVLGIYNDITERKHDEEALKIAKELAEAAYRSKSEFVLNISHDIRTPVAGIIGILDILLRRLKNETDLEFAQDAYNASQRLLKLLNEVLELSQISDGSIQKQNQVFKLSDIINNVTELMRPLAKKKNLHFEVIEATDIPEYLYGQDILLNRIFINLLSNAIKFTPSGHVKLTTKKLAQSETEITIKIVIEDTGIGIPKDKQNVIFESFRRLTPSYEGNYSGTGLGLFITKEFVNLLNGSIEISSEPNKGSRFTCVFPIRISKADINHTAAEPSVLTVDPQHPSPHPSAARNLKILLVEDDLLSQKIARLNIETLLCSVTLASTGKQAMQLAGKFRYDLIFLDIGLPDHSGIDVASTIRNSENNAATPIVALTAHLDQEGEQLCYENGIDLVIRKPLTTENTIAVFKKFGLVSG